MISPPTRCFLEGPVLLVCTHAWNAAPTLIRHHVIFCARFVVAAVARGTCLFLSLTEIHFRNIMQSLRPPENFPSLFTHFSFRRRNMTCPVVPRVKGSIVEILQEYQAVTFTSMRCLILNEPGRVLFCVFFKYFLTYIFDSGTWSTTISLRRAKHSMCCLAHAGNAQRKQTACVGLPGRSRFPRISEKLKSRVLVWYSLSVDCISLNRWCPTSRSRSSGRPRTVTTSTARVVGKIFFAVVSDK